MERAIEKMKIVVPVTLLLIFLLLYLNFRRMTETLIVMLSVPFALVGGVWLMWALGYNLSVAVAVGFIALAGVAAETGVVMLIYLDHAWEAAQVRCREAGPRARRRRPLRRRDGRRGERVRPKMMTVVAIMAGLLPIMWGTGTGSEVMSRIAAPMVGGMISSTVLTLAVIPALYALVKQWQLRARPAGAVGEAPARTLTGERRVRQRRRAARLSSAARPQPQRVRDHGRGTQAHRQRRDHRRQQPAGERVQHAGRQRNAERVVDEGEAEVLLHVAHGLLREPPRPRDAAQVALDQRDLRAVHRDVGARAHRDADIGLGQRRRIVDAVAGHRDDACPSRCSLLDERELVRAA